MRVLLVHNRYRERGGEDQVFESELELLTSHGHDVRTYVRSNDEIGPGSMVQNAIGTIWSGTTHRDVSAMLEASLVDVVHVHNTLPLVSPSVYHAARSAKVPTVQTLHNYRLMCPAAMFLRAGAVCEACLGKRIPWPSVVHACYRGSRASTSVVAAMLAWHHARGTYADVVTHYIALSEFAVAKHVEGGIPAHRMSVRPNYLLHDPGAGDGSGGYALFVGRLAPEKGVATLLDAWRLLAGRVPLHIVGDGPMASDVAVAAHAGIGVTWLGRLDRLEVLEAMRRAALLVLPSHVYEGFPVTAVEAMATGTPIVASDLGVLREIIVEGANGVRFARGDGTDLARKVEALLSDGPRLSRLRSGARARFLESYTADRAYRRLMEIYRVAGVDAP